MLHELWEDPEPDQGGHLTFCLAGPRGEKARRDLSPRARLVWSVEAASHFEAMTTLGGIGLVKVGAAQQRRA